MDFDADFYMIFYDLRMTKFRFLKKSAEVISSHIKVSVKKSGIPNSKFFKLLLCSKFYLEAYAITRFTNHLFVFNESSNVCPNRDRQRKCI